MVGPEARRRYLGLDVLARSRVHILTGDTDTTAEVTTNNNSQALSA
jgi:hypothetical protein